MAHPPWHFPCAISAQSSPAAFATTSGFSHAHSTIKHAQGCPPSAITLPLCLTAGFRHYIFSAVYTSQDTPCRVFMQFPDFFPLVRCSCSFPISFHTLSSSFAVCLFFIYSLSLNSIINKLIFQTFSPCSTFCPSCVFFSISPLSNSHIPALHITVKNPQIGSTSQFTAPTSTIYFDLIFRLFAQF